MELRIENGRGKWRTVKSQHDLFYKALDEAVDAAFVENGKLAADDWRGRFYPVVYYGAKQERVFVVRAAGGQMYISDAPSSAEAYEQWVPVGALSPAGEKPKREVSPERREQLAKNLEKARAARGKK